MISTEISNHGVDPAVALEALDLAGDLTLVRDTQEEDKMAGPPRRKRISIRAERLYRTRLGAAYAGDSAELLKLLPSRSIQAIITSPPYALHFKKEYGNLSPDDYVDWFLGFADEFRRVLRPNGSLVIEIGGAWNKGQPTRSIYLFDLLVRLVKEKEFYLAQEFFWFNKARMPSPAEWVNVRRIRVKDAVTPIWWLSLSPEPKANNRRVLNEYSDSMRLLFKRGYNKGKRPSGHVAKHFERDNGGAIPANVIDTREVENLIEVANTSSRNGYDSYCDAHGLEKHPARFPRDVPKFFVNFLTTPGDWVLDPFAGSNVTGAVAEVAGRHWIAFEKDRGYLKGSRGRFSTLLR